MERNQIIGLVVIGVLITLWLTFFKPEPPKPEPVTSKNTIENSKIPEVQSKTVFNNNNKSDSSAYSKYLNEKYGIFATIANSNTNAAKKIRVKTNKLSFEINTRGGAISPVYLNEYKTYDSLPLPIVSADPRNKFGLKFNIQGRIVSTDSLYFYTQENEKVEIKGNESKAIVLRANVDSSRYIELKYAIKNNAYDIEYSVRMVGLGEIITDDSYILSEQIDIPRTEKSPKAMSPEVSLNYKIKDEDAVEKLDPTEQEPLKERPVASLDWVAFKSQFFTHAIIPTKTKFKSSSELVQVAYPVADTSEFIRHFEAGLYIPYNHGQDEAQTFKLYYGPNDRYIMEKYNVDLDKVINFGWGPIRYITLLIVFVFHFLEQFIGNYGVIITLLALFIKLLLSPLTYKSYLSTAKMQIVNKMPEMQEIDKKYKDNPNDLQMKKMAFYQQLGINPLGGCIPVLLQLPILISMFTFFPQSISLRQKPFLWATDLSAYDSIWDFGCYPVICSIYGDHMSLFTILMTITTLIYTYIQQKGQPNTGPAGMKYIGYIMPVIFLGILNNYSAGLSYYYFVLNVLTIGQTFLIKAFLDEKKIIEKLQTVRKERSNPNRKKSKFQQLLEEQQKLKQQQNNKRR